MHMLIRVLVPAVDSSEAVSTARYALDRLIGIGDGASTAFDYYKTLDESTARYRDHPRYDGLDPALPLQSETGRQLLEDAVEAQEAWFRETLDKLRVKLESLDCESVMDDVDLTRFDCYRLGQFAGLLSTRPVRRAICLDLRPTRRRPSFSVSGRTASRTQQ